MAKDEEKKEVKKTKRPTAQKRELQNEKRRLANKANRSRIRSEVKSYQKVCSTESQPVIQESVQKLHSSIDKAAKKGLFSVNKASRMKSRLTKLGVKK